MKFQAFRIVLLAMMAFTMPGFVSAKKSLCPPNTGFSGSMMTWLMGKGQFAKGNPADLSAEWTSLLQQGQTEAVLKQLHSLGSDSVAGLGVYYLAAGKPEESLLAFSTDSLPDSLCHYPELILAARYLQLYGNKAPIFPGFNGGFYNFLKDSLYIGEKLSVDRFEKAVSALYMWVRLTGGKSAVALELFGDILYRHPDRFIGNYFGALVYMRAASLCEGSSKDALMTKSIFALESPAEVAKRFDRYRFTQIQQAFFSDLEGGESKDSEGSTPEVASAGIVYMDASNKGELATIFSRAHARILTGVKKTVVTDQVDARKVKQDTTFNVYALFMISAVIGSVIFFWVKIKRAQRAK